MKRVVLLFLLLFGFLFISPCFAGNYANKIYYQYPTATENDFRLEDDGSGVVLKYWNVAKLGAKPTLADLDLIDDALADGAALDREAQNTIEVSKKDRLLFEIHFDLENRIRILEGKSAITKQQYKNAIVALYKTL